MNRTCFRGLKNREKIIEIIILNISLTSLVSVGGIAPFVVEACVLVVGSVEKLNM